MSDVISLIGAMLCTAYIGFLFGFILGVKDSNRCGHCNAMSPSHRKDCYLA